MPEEDLRLQIRRARGKFASMLVAYSLGVFNDNFFRQSAMLIAVALGMRERQGLLLNVFALPYLLFASQAGWLADRFSKRRIIIGAKFLELLAMCCGAVGILTTSWPLLVAMVFLMGLQSSVFGPSLNGSIPELYPAGYVRRAYAIVKAVVTAMILLGVSASGLVLRHKLPVAEGLTLGPLVAAVVVVAVSVGGFLGSFGVPRRRAADPKKRFPWGGPVNNVINLLATRKDPLLGKAIVANSFAWFIGALIIPVLNVLAGKEHFNDEGVPSLLIGAELVGVAAGGLISARIVHDRTWHRVLAPAALVMTVPMFAMAGTVLLPEAAQLPAMVLLMAAIGLPGGLFMVQCEAFFQIHPPPGDKGTVIAAANCASFIGVVLAANLSVPMIRYVSPTGCFAFMGGVALTAGIWLALVLPKTVEA